MRSMRMRVPDLSCQHCVRAVSEALREVDGVKEVEVSLDHLHATVRMEDHVSAADLSRAVRAAGYSPEPIGDEG